MHSASGPSESRLGLCLAVPLYLDTTYLQVMYVCVEDLVESRIPRIIEEIRGHLQGNRPHPGVRRFGPSHHGQMKYNGSHSTVGSGLATRETQAALLGLLRRIDRMYLGGELQRTQALFQCG